MSPRWLIALVVLGGVAWLLQAARSQRGASMVGMSQPGAPQLAPVSTTPAPAPSVIDTPPPPPAPAVLDSPIAEPVRPLGPGAVAAPNEVAPLPEGWNEQVSSREQPTIEVHNTLPPGFDPPALIFRHGTEVYRMDCVDRITSMQLPAGSYEYELHGDHWAREHEPDQTGQFRCRQYRSYTLTVVDLVDHGTRQGDIGDPG